MACVQEAKQGEANQQPARSPNHTVSGGHLGHQHLLLGSWFLLHAQSARLCLVACFVSPPLKRLAVGQHHHLVNTTTWSTSPLGQHHHMVNTTIWSTPPHGEHHHVVKTTTPMSVHPLPTLCWQPPIVHFLIMYAYKLHRTQNLQPLVTPVLHLVANALFKCEKFTLYWRQPA